MRHHKPGTEEWTMKKAGFFIMVFVMCPIYVHALDGSPPAEIVLASQE